MHLRQWLLIQVTMWNLSFLYYFLALGSLLEPSSSSLSPTTGESLSVNATNAHTLSSTVGFISTGLLASPLPSFKSVGGQSPATSVNNGSILIEAAKSNDDIPIVSIVFTASNHHELSSRREWNPSLTRRQGVGMTASSKASTLHPNFTIKPSSAFTFHSSLLSQNGNISPWSTISISSATSIILPSSTLSPSSSTLTVSGSGQNRSRGKRSPGSIDPMDLVSQQSSIEDLNVSGVSVSFETDSFGKSASTTFRNISPTLSTATSQVDSNLAASTASRLHTSYLESVYLTSLSSSPTTTYTTVLTKSPFSSTLSLSSASLLSSPSSSPSSSSSSSYETTSTTMLITSSFPSPISFQVSPIPSLTPTRVPSITTLASSQRNASPKNTLSSSPSSSVLSMLPSLPSTLFPSLSSSSLSSSNKLSSSIPPRIMSTPSFIHPTSHSTTSYNWSSSSTSPTPPLSSPPSSTSSPSSPIPPISVEHFYNKSHLYTNTGSYIISEAIVATAISDSHQTRPSSSPNVSIATRGLLASSSSLEPSGSLSVGLQSSPSPSSAGYAPGAQSRNAGSESYNIIVTIQSNSSILIIMPCMVGMTLFLLMVAGYKRCREHRKKDILLPLSARQMGLHGSNDTAAFRRSRKSILENNGKSPDFHENVSLTPKIIVHSNGGHSPYIQPHRISDPLYDDNGLSIDKDDRGYNKALITDGKETSQIRVFVHPHRMTSSPRKPSSSTSVGDSDHEVSYGEINPVFQADDDDYEKSDQLDGIFLVENVESTREGLENNRESVTSDVTSDGGMTSAQVEPSHSCRLHSHCACDLCKAYDDRTNGPVHAVTKL